MSRTGKQAGTRRLIQYWDYLEVPKLLSLQSPFPAPFEGESETVYDRDAPVRTYPPGRGGRRAFPELSADELFFISIHQSFEIWFQVILTSLGIARDHLQAAAEPGRDEEHLERAAYHLTRGAAILQRLVGQIETLATLPGREFLRMRKRLGTSSGFESYQFRMLEYHLGVIYAPPDFVEPPPRSHGIAAFITAYRAALAEAERQPPRVDGKVGPDLYHGSALSGLGRQLGAVGQRRREIDHIESLLAWTYTQSSLKDAWFRWLGRRLPLATPKDDVPTLLLAGVLGGVRVSEPVRGLSVSDPVARLRERSLRRMAAPHRFEEWARIGHEAMRTAWKPAVGDRAGAIAERARRGQLTRWDEEIAPFLRDAGGALAVEAPATRGEDGGAGEELLAVLGHFPAAERVVRCWLGAAAAGSRPVASDPSYLALDPLKVELEQRHLYGQLSDGVLRLAREAIPELAGARPGTLDRAGLVRAADRLAVVAGRTGRRAPDRGEIETVWQALIGSLRTPLAAAIGASAGSPRRQVRCRYALLYQARVERVRRLLEDPTELEVGDRGRGRDAGRRKQAVGGLARTCAERLLDIDEAVANWRAHHVAVIARVIGTRKGTAGTGTEYLAQSLGPRGMPELVDGIGRVGRPTS